MITPYYAAILALIFSFLSLRTICLRRGLQVALGDGKNHSLKRAIRVHGNFAEYVPFALLLIFFLENSGVTSSSTIHRFGALLVLGRVVHAAGMSRVKEPIKLRVAGTVLTQSVIIGVSLRLLFA